MGTHKGALADAHVFAANAYEVLERVLAARFLGRLRRRIELSRKNVMLCAVVGRLSDGGGVRAREGVALIGRWLVRCAVAWKGHHAG